MLNTHNNSEQVDFTALEQAVDTPDWHGAIVEESALAELELSGEYKTTYSAWFNPGHDRYRGLTQEGMTKSFLEDASFVRQKHFEERELQPFSDYMIVLLADKPGFEIRRRVEDEVDEVVADAATAAIGRVGVYSTVV